MDTSLTTAMNHFLVNHDSIEDSLLFYERISELIFIGVLVALFAFGGEDGLWRRKAAVGAATATALALVAGQVISRLVDRPRPFVAHPDQVHLFAKHVADAGFPSDHATAAFAIAVAIFLRSRKLGSFVIAAAVLLAVGRVAIGVHYPSDVLAGAALGSLCALLLWWEPLRKLTDQIAERITMGSRPVQEGPIRSF